MITSLTCNNFKDKSYAIELSARTAIIGPVGSGKSSILELVRLCVGLPTRHGATGLGNLASSGQWDGLVTISVANAIHRASRSQSGGRSELRFDGAVVKEGDFKVKLAVHTGIGAVPDVDLNEFISKSGQERASLFARLLANQPVSMEDAVKGATGMGVAAFIKAETGKDVESGPWAAVTGTPSDIVDQAKNMVNEMKSKARDAEAHLRALLEKPIGEHEDLGSLQTKLGEVNKRLGEISGLIENMDNAIAAKQAAEKSLESLDSRVSKLRSLADELEKSLPAKLELAEQVKVQVDGLIADLDAAEAGRDKLLAELEDAAKQRGKAPPGDPLASLDMYSLVPVPAGVVFEVANLYGIDHRATLQSDLLERVIKPWIAAQRESFKDAAKAYETAKSALEDSIAVLKGRHADAQKSCGRHQKLLGEAKQYLARLNSELDHDRKHILENRQDADKAQASRSDLVAAAQRAVVFADKVVLEAEQKTKSAESETLGAAIRSAQAAAQVKGQIDRAQLDHMQALAWVKGIQAIAGKLQTWRDQITKAGMDAVLAPFRSAVSSVMPGSMVDIRIGGSGRSTTFEFVIVRDGVPVRLEHLSAGETALVGAAFLSAMHTLMQSKARLLTIDAEALDDPSLIRLLEAVPTLGFDFCLFASNQLRRDMIPEGWAVHDCSQQEATV